MVKEAIRLNPHYPVWYLDILGWAYRLMKRYEEAKEVLHRALIRNPDFLTTHALLAMVYIETGHIEEARAQVEEILRINPDYSLELLRERLPFKDQAILEGALDIMRKAGLK